MKGWKMRWREEKCMKPNLQRTKSSWREGKTGWEGGAGEGVGPKITVVENSLKHILVLEFLKFEEILRIGFFL